MAFRWRADDGPTLNAGLVVLKISGDPVHPVLLRNSILLGGGGGGGGGSAHGTGQCIHLFTY